MFRLHKCTYCVYTKESLVYTQEISCACTTLLCMLWAREPRGQGPKRALGPVPGPGRAMFGPWPLGSLAQSTHKSVVHAQEISCVCTRDSFVYTQEISCIGTRISCVDTGDLLCTHKRYLVFTQQILTVC